MIMTKGLEIRKRLLEIIAKIDPKWKNAKVEIINKEAEGLWQTN